MTDRPILFSGAMVRPILAGTKTQTRRLVKPRTGNGLNVLDSCFRGDPASKAWVGANGAVGVDTHGGVCGPGLFSPYGASGDRLWVRETWRVVDEAEGDIGYRADLSTRRYLSEGDAEWWKRWGAKSAPRSVEGGARWMPAIYMPRWASRVTLAVESVRIERLQDISEDDARAEGLTALTKDGGRTVKYGVPDRDGWPGTDDDGWPWTEWSVSARNAYWNLWDSINIDRAPWSSNHWVWVVTFSVAA